MPAKISSRFCFSFYPHPTPWTGRVRCDLAFGSRRGLRPRAQPSVAGALGIGLAWFGRAFERAPNLPGGVLPSSSGCARAESHFWQFPSHVKVQLRESISSRVIFFPQASGKTFLYPQQSSTLNHLYHSREGYGPFMFSFTSASGGFPNHVA